MAFYQSHETHGRCQSRGGSRPRADRAPAFLQKSQIFRLKFCQILSLLLLCLSNPRSTLMLSNLFPFSLSLLSIPYPLSLILLCALDPIISPQIYNNIPSSGLKYCNNASHPLPSHFDLTPFCTNLGYGSIPLFLQNTFSILCVINRSYLYPSPKLQ